MHSKLAITRPCERGTGATERHSLRRFPASCDAGDRCSKDRPHAPIEDPCSGVHSPRTVDTVQSSGTVLSRSLCASMLFHLLALTVFYCLPKPVQELLPARPILVSFTTIPEEQSPPPIPEPPPSPKTQIASPTAPTHKAEVRPETTPLPKLVDPTPSPGHASPDTAERPAILRAPENDETTEVAKVRPPQATRETQDSFPIAAVNAAGPSIEAAPNPANNPTGRTESPDALAHPLYKKNPEPGYPASARRRRQEGVVLLKVQVSEEGKATRVELQRSSGFASLDDTALQAVKGWEFEPARSGLRRVACTIEVPVRFALKH